MPRRAPDPTTITFTLDKATKHSLRLLAAQEDGGMSALLRGIITEALARQKPPGSLRRRAASGVAEAATPTTTVTGLEAPAGDDLALL